VTDRRSRIGLAFELAASAAALGAAALALADLGRSTARHTARIFPTIYDTSIAAP